MNWFENPGGDQSYMFDLKDLPQLLEEFEVLAEHDTMLCETIRKLKKGDHIYVQEQNWKREGVLHQMESMQEADAKIKDRLETYERMWDGCGCKVDHLK